MTDIKQHIEAQVGAVDTASDTAELKRRLAEIESQIMGVNFSLLVVVESLQDELERRDRERDFSAKDALSIAISKVQHVIAGLPGVPRASETLPAAGWPQHEPKRLAALRAAANKFWKNYDPEDPETAPSSSEVIDYLVGEHGVTQSLAQSMATILRPTELPPRLPSRVQRE